LDARTGKKIRMGRLFDHESGRSLIVAYSHGILAGPKPGIRTLSEMQRISDLLRRADGLMVAPGMVTRLESSFIGKDRPSLVVHVDWQNYSRDVLSPAGDGTVTGVARVEDVAAAGADAIMTYMFIGQQSPELERAEIERNASFARECDRQGLVLMIEARSARERSFPDDKTSTEIMSLCCRIAAEIGADIVKCPWPGSLERFAPIAETCSAPVLVAGGLRKDDTRAALEQAAQAIAAGAAGLVFGRNIYQHPYPQQALEAFRAIVHGGQSVESAVAIADSARARE
jgi:fructose-bisphosphate aldolase, class I